MLSPQARRIGRRQAALAATWGLGLAYLAGTTFFSLAEKRLVWDWVAQVDTRQGVLLGAGVLYGGAWLVGGWAGPAILVQQRRAGQVGTVAALLALLPTLLLGSGWNFAQAAIRFAPFPGTTAADLEQHVISSLVDYVGKPLAGLLPLGILLGGWFGRRVGRAGRPG